MKTVLIVAIGLLASLIYIDVYAATEFDKAIQCPTGYPTYKVSAGGGQYPGCSGAKDCMEKKGLTDYTESGYNWKYELASVISGQASGSVYYTKKNYYASTGAPVGTSQSGSFTVQVICGADPCADFEGNEVAGVKMASSATQACVNSCKVSTTNPTGGKRVSVSFASEPEYQYTTAYHLGQSCTITEATPGPIVDNDYKMEVVDGVPTFTQTGLKPLKLASVSDGTSGNIESQVAVLNPDVPLEVSASNTSGGSDVSTGDVVPNSTVSNTVVVNNITNNNGTPGSYSISWNDGSMSSSGSTGGSTDGTDGGADGGTDGGTDVDLSGVESKLDDIKDAIDGLGDGVEFSADQSSSKTFGQSTQDFMTGLSDAPIMSMLDNVNLGSAGGCVGLSASLPFGNVSTTLHCEVYESVSGILSAVMLFVFTFLGIRIILSA